MPSLIKEIIGGSLGIESNVVRLEDYRHKKNKEVVPEAEVQSQPAEPAYPQYQRKMKLSRMSGILRLDYRPTETLEEKELRRQTIREQSEVFYRIGNGGRM